MRAVETMPELQEDVRTVRELCTQAIDNQRELYDTKVDQATLETHQEAFAAGQEQLSQQLAHDINSVLEKLEASAGGFKVLHDSITDLVASKADRRDLDSLKKALRDQDANRVASPLSVKCLSCHQTLPVDPSRTPGRP